MSIIFNCYNNCHHIWKFPCDTVVLEEVKSNLKMPVNGIANKDNSHNRHGNSRYLKYFLYGMLSYLNGVLLKSCSFLASLRSKFFRFCNNGTNEA